MYRGYSAWLSCNSKYATKEQKKITIDAIINAGVEGISTKDLRSINGLSSHDHNSLMTNLRGYDGRIRRVGKIGGGYNVWGMFA